MTLKHPPLGKSKRVQIKKAGVTKENTLSTFLLPRLLESWLVANDIARHSENTIAARRERCGKLIWFLNHKEHSCCGLEQLRAFFTYLNHGHKETGGMWGNPKMTKPLSSGRVKTYYVTLRTFFNWLITEGEITTSPLVRIPVPIDRPDQVRPFTDEELRHSSPQ